jgi:2-oxoglutarate/2-oxoacid ferredoxin oxidoreductase subunit alpha
MSATTESKTVDFSVLIAGAAGEGIQTIGAVAAQTILSHGYPVFASQEFESRIRGGFSGYRLRIGGSNAPREDVDILLALNPEAKEHYRETLREGGLIISESGTGPGELGVPFREIAKEDFGGEIYANTIAAGSLVSALGIELDALLSTLRARFGKAGEDVLEANLAAAKAGHDKLTALKPPVSLPPRKATHTHLSAHDAFVLGAAYAGCRFMAAYPMSPSTGIITAFAKDPGLGVLVEQAEDEIAAANLAIGASYAGARAMTATSGGGFALMVESVSLSGMSETPLVIVLAQRPGPATGLATRTAQEDLLFTIHAGHGEFPKAVLAPADAKDAFEKAKRAFALAERFQIPVVVLTDQFLADAGFSYDDVPLGPQPEIHDFAKPEDVPGYGRYALTEDGISPRLYPGQSTHIVRADSHTHEESGDLTEDLATVRPATVRKQLAKLEGLRREIAPPEAVHLEDADEVLIGWGSSRGAIDEAMRDLRATGRRIGRIHFTELWPLPQFHFPEGKRYLTVEGNATGQLAQLLAGGYGLRVAGTIGRFDGLPLTAAHVKGGLDADA